MSRCEWRGWWRGRGAVGSQLELLSELQTADGGAKRSHCSGWTRISSSIGVDETETHTQVLYVTVMSHVESQLDSHKSLKLEE